MKYESKDLLDLYEIKVQEHWYTLFAPILRYLGDITSSRILDIGCGTGDLSNVLSRRAMSVTGVDISQQWIDHCNAQYKAKNLDFIQASASDLWAFEDGGYDVVILNMVLPNIHSAEEVRRIFWEVKRVVKKWGIFVFSDLHPICVMTKKEWNRRQEYSKDFSYFRDGDSFSAIVTLPNGGEITFSNSHWTLGCYTEILSEMGMVIDRIMESEYPPEAPKELYRYPFPEYIIFGCKNL